MSETVASGPQIGDDGVVESRAMGGGATSGSRQFRAIR
jgi:hypothetical protein